MGNITVTIPTNNVTYVNSNNISKHNFIDFPQFKGLSIFGQRNWFYTLEFIQLSPTPLNSSATNGVLSPTVTPTTPPINNGPINNIII